MKIYYWVLFKAQFVLLSLSDTKCNHLSTMLPRKWSKQGENVLTCVGLGDGGSAMAWGLSNKTCSRREIKTRCEYVLLWIAKTCLFVFWGRVYYRYLYKRYHKKKKVWTRLPIIIGNWLSRNWANWTFSTTPSPSQWCASWLFLGRELGKALGKVWWSLELSSKESHALELCIWWDLLSLMGLSI